MELITETISRTEPFLRRNHSNKKWNWLLKRKWIVESPFCANHSNKKWNWLLKQLDHKYIDLLEDHSNKKWNWLLKLYYLIHYLTYYITAIRNGIDYWNQYNIKPIILGSITAIRNGIDYWNCCCSHLNCEYKSQQ